MDPNTQKSSSTSGRRKRSAPRPPRFDTMRAVGNLKEAEFREQQAVAIVETIRDSQVELATRDDLHAGLEKLELVLRNEIGKLRTEMRDEIGSLRTEMRDEIGGLRTEMRDEIGGLRTEMRSGTGEFRAEVQKQFATMYWRFLIGFGIAIGILGTIVTFVSGA